MHAGNHQTHGKDATVHKSTKLETAQSPTHGKTDTPRRTIKNHRAEKTYTCVTCTKNILYVDMYEQIDKDVCTQQAEA